MCRRLKSDKIFNRHVLPQARWRLVYAAAYEVQHTLLLGIKRLKLGVVIGREWVGFEAWVWLDFCG